MGFRNVIITQHSKLSYSNNAMIVQNKDGINQIPLVDMDILLISTTQAVITSALVSKLAESGIKVIFTDRQIVKFKLNILVDRKTHKGL